MRAGLPISFLAHGALLAYAMLSIGSPTPFKVAEPEPVEVAIITEDGLTRLRQGDRSSKLLEAKEAPPAPDSKAEKPVNRPKPPEPAAPPPEPEPPAAEMAPPPPPPEKKAEPPPEKQADPIADKLAMLPPVPQGPSPEELARQEAEKKAAEEAKRKAEQETKRREAEAKRKADEKKKAEDKKRKELAEKKRRELERKKKLAEQRKREAEKRKKQQKQEDFFAEMQKALKDNDPTRKAAPAGGATTTSSATKRGPTAGAPEGTDTRLTASQNAMLGLLIKDAVKSCWNINTGAQGIENIVVKVEVKLNVDGTLAREPRVINSSPGPLFADTALSAIRAVKQCGPYDFPKNLYKGGWDQAIWTFDPRRMF